MFPFGRTSFPANVSTLLQGSAPIGTIGLGQLVTDAFRSIVAHRIFSDSATVRADIGNVSEPILNLRVRP